jgi:hypothetical protein
MIVMVANGVGEADFLCLQHETGLTHCDLSRCLARPEESDNVRVEKIIMAICL